jgi:hypothetical protein
MDWSKIMLGKMVCLLFNWLSNTTFLRTQNLSMVLRSWPFFPWNYNTAVGLKLSLLILSHYDLRRDLVETTSGIVIHSLYHNCVFSLKMACKDETCRWWKTVNKVVSRHFLDRFIYSIFKHNWTELNWTEPTLPEFRQSIVTNQSG